MKRLIYALLLGLLGAGIVHIAILFMLPRYSAGDAWNRLADAAELNKPARAKSVLDTRSPSAFSDPFFALAMCRFDLSAGAVHVRAEGTVPFWSISLYGRNGLNAYSLNDRAAADRALDLVVVRPEQMAAMRKELPPAFAKSIFVETGLNQGVIVVRVFVPDETWRPLVSDYLAGLTCEAQ